MTRRTLAFALGAMLAVVACGTPPPPTPANASVPPPSSVSTPASVLPTLTPAATAPATAPPSSTPTAATVLTTTPYGVKVACCVNAGSTAVGFGSLWVPILAQPHGWLVRIDMATDRVTGRIAVGESPDSVAIVGGSVWVANTIGDGSRRYAGQNTLSRIDPRTNRVVGTVPLEIGGPIVGGFGAVWVMGFENGDGNGTLRKVDAATGRIVAAFALTGLPAIACGALWTIDAVEGANVPPVTIVSRIDPRSGRRTARWPVSAYGGGIPQDALGRCFAVIPNPEGAYLGSTIAVIVPDEGVGRVSPAVPTPVRIVGGSFWSVSEVGVVQPLGEDGTPNGPATALPPATLDDGDWAFLRVDGTSWVVSGAGVFLVRLSG